MKLSQRITFCGALCALALVILLATVFPFVTYALAALAGIVLVPATLELGWRYGVISYAITAVLAALMTPDMEAKMLFILFLGYYPSVRIRLSLMFNRVLSWVLKETIFNVAIVSGYCIMLWGIGLPEDALTIAGIHLPIVFWIVANAVFVIYDIALDRVTALYRVRLHPLVQSMFK